MLPKIECPDIFDVPPDSDGIDLWSGDFSWDSVPDSPGVYCFYRADTGELVYIGSACARSKLRENRGLRMRLQFYRSRKRMGVSASVRKVQDEALGGGILCRCWATMTSGDARKYECDAIERYCPVLNTEHAVRIATKEELRIMKSASTKKKQHAYADRDESELPKGSEPKFCPSCNTMKTMGDFYPNKYRKDGRRSECRDCQSKSSKAQKARSMGVQCISEEQLVEMMG